MIVSRSMLKEIRSKGTVDNRGRQENKKLISKKSMRQSQKLQRYPLEDLSKSKTYLNDSFLFREQETEVKVKKAKVFEQNGSKNKSTVVKKEDSFILALQQITPQVNLSQRSISQMKFDLSNQFALRQICRLNLSHNQIKQILPTILLPFQFLQYLDLSNNKLQKISFPYNKMGLKEFKVSENKLANLNLQHLKCLQSIYASYNKLIFITLPQSIKHIKLDHNMLANTYFIEKCSKVQHLSINFNFIYDLNFNSMSELDGMIKKNTSKSTFKCLKTIECSNNKICHLNGFQNLRVLQTLNMNNNELSLSRENVNQLLLLQSIEYLSMEGNSQQGVYSQQEFKTMLFDKLPNIKTINSKHENTTNQPHKNDDKNIDNYNQQDNFYLFQSTLKKEINDQSTIRQNQFSLQYSAQKPFRLFIDDQLSQKHHSGGKTQQQNYQRIYTLGDVDDKVEGQQNDEKIFQIMTLPNKNQGKILTTHQKNQFKEFTQDVVNDNNQKLSTLQKSNQKIQQLQKQLSKASSKILIPMVNNKKPQLNNFQITLETKKILKMIYEMSFIPPQALKYSSNSLVISTRLDQDQDEYYLFTKLFEKKKGILYLKKIFVLQDTDPLFQSDRFLIQKQYGLGFFNAPNLEEIYKKMLKSDSLLSDLLDSKMLSNLANYLSPIPGAFGCHHIVVRHLIKKTSAFDKRNLTPVCYLIESKII